MTIWGNFKSKRKIKKFLPRNLLNIFMLKKFLIFQNKGSTQFSCIAPKKLSHTCPKKSNFLNGSNFLYFCNNFQRDFYIVCERFDAFSERFLYFSCTYSRLLSFIFVRNIIVQIACILTFFISFFFTKFIFYKNLLYRILAYLRLLFLYSSEKF